jgi:hypothetical protein
MPAMRKTSRTIRSCWPVETTTGRKPLLARRARTMGMSLIASGRVPTTTRMLTFGGDGGGVGSEAESMRGMHP